MKEYIVLSGNLINTGIKTQVLGIKAFDGIYHLLAWFKIEFVSIKVVHKSLFYIFSLQRYCFYVKQPKNNSKILLNKEKEPP